MFLQALRLKYYLINFKQFPLKHFINILNMKSKL